MTRFGLDLIALFDHSGPKSHENSVCKQLGSRFNRAEIRQAPLNEDYWYFWMLGFELGNQFVCLLLFMQLR